MKDEERLKRQLIDELEEMRRRIAELESLDVERKRTGEALRESEERYRNLVERASDGICIIQDTVVKYVNPCLAEMWGGTVEEVIGTSFTEYVHPDELPRVVERYRRRMAGEEVPSMYETVLKRKDGSKVYAELSAGTITYQGEPADLVIVRDITDRKRWDEIERMRYRVRSIQEPEEWLQIPDMLDEVLVNCGVEFSACGVNIVNLEERTMQMYTFENHRLAETDFHGPTVPVIEAVVREQRTIYRCDTLVPGEFAEGFTSEQGMLGRRSVVDVPFVGGTVAMSSSTPDAFTERDIETLEMVADVITEGYARYMGLAERKKAERELWRRAALDGVRVSVYEMREPEDIQSVLVSLYEGLKSVGVEFDNCSVELINEEKGYIEAYYLGPDRMYPIGERQLTDGAVYEAWRNKRVVYRRDLDEEDKYDKKTRLRELSGKPIRSVLDVPFSRGTIAVNSLQPEAFSDEDIETLQLFAGVLSEAYTRFEDIQKLASVETLRRTLGTLSHHINNAMTAIAGHAELCDRGNIESCQKLAEVCLSQTKRISAVLNALDKMVKEADIRTVSYAGLPDFMFDIEEELRRTLEKT